MNKKLLAKIVIPIVALGIFLMPISPALNLENNKIALNAEINKARAQNAQVGVVFDPAPTVSYEETDNIVKITASMKSADGKTTIETYNAFFVALFKTSAANTKPEASSKMVDYEIVQPPNNNDADPNGTYIADSDNNPILIKFKNTFVFNDSLEKGQSYSFIVGVLDKEYTFNTLFSTWTYSSMLNTLNAKKLSFAEGYVTAGQSGQLAIDSSTDQVAQNSYDLGCGIGNLALGAATGFLSMIFDNARVNIVGCFAELSYAIFGIVNYLAELAGRLLDFFVYYSTNSLAYATGFVTKGWAIVRDVANIFFIIGLLYVAIKTVLGLNVSDNKKLIGSIIIMALLINFSLFITQVVIDSSNILAKVFYNQINSEVKNADGTINTTNETVKEGEKSISKALIAKFNPQKIMSSEQAQKYTGTYLFIIIIMILIMGYTAWIFFTVAILFVSRVVALWIAIIFSPIAFASYTVPFKIPGFGHQDWWGDLFKSAFLAPIFIFFLYIIAMFADLTTNYNNLKYGTDTTLVNPNNANELMLKIMAVMIPFILIFILLKKAKEIAVKMSGELGKEAMKLQGYATGTAGVGMVAAYFGQKAVKGGSALAQKTIGRASSSIGERIRGDTAVGRFWKNRFTDAGKASYNLGAIIPGALSKNLHLGDLKPRYANYAERKEALLKRKQERVKQLERGPNTPEAIAARKAEAHYADVKAEKEAEKVKAYSYKVVTQEDVDQIKKSREDLTATYVAAGMTPINAMKKAITEIKGIGKVGDTVVSDKADKDQTLSELKETNKIIKGKIGLKDGQIKDANGEVLAAQNKLNTAMAEGDATLINTAKNAVTAAEAEYNKLKKERLDLIKAMTHNVQKEDGLEAPIHHAHIHAVNEKNKLNAINRKLLKDVTKNWSEGTFSAFNTLKVGGMGFLDQYCDEVRIEGNKKFETKQAPHSAKAGGH